MKKIRIIISNICGKVKIFKKGYGFINFLNNKLEINKDIFVHYSKILSNDKFKKLNEGDLVEFDLIEFDNGQLRAINVKKIDRIKEIDL